MTTGCTLWSIDVFYDRTIVATRNFYGVLRVQRFGQNDSTDRRSLIHGTIVHGTQSLSPDLRAQPTSYYTQTSGVGRLLESLHPSLTPLKIGVIGLGAGTLATYGAKGEVFRFYDINPAVLRIAERDFSFLQDSARRSRSYSACATSLEREAEPELRHPRDRCLFQRCDSVHITSQALGSTGHMKPEA
jgi:hypothetical protein